MSCLGRASENISASCQHPGPVPIASLSWAKRSPFASDAAIQQAMWMNASLSIWRGSQPAKVPTEMLDVYMTLDTGDKGRQRAVMPEPFGKGMMGTPVVLSL
jgi:hypothetical protein